MARSSLIAKSLLCVGALLCLVAETEAQAPYEKPPTLSARELLPENLRKGAYHEVANKVTSDGYFNNYTIKSKFGVFEVEGQQLLEIRIGELMALAELDKLSSSKVFQDAVVASGKATLLAPVHAVKKVYNTVSDPDKVVDTVKAVPEGAEKLFSWAYRQVKGAAQAASDLVSSDSDSNSSEGAGVVEGSTAALRAGKDFGLKFLGYTKRERELFQQLQVNPYTSNDEVQSEIVRVAGIGTAVGFAFRFVPGFGILGELSTFNRWYSRAEQLALYEDPEVIQAKNRAELRAMEIPDELAEEFQSNKVYNPWTRRFITASLTALGPSVGGKTLFIKAALQAKNEPSTLYFVSVAEHLEKVNKERPLKKIVSSMYLPAGVTKSGTLYVPLSVDYLFWTEEVSGIFADFRQRVTREESFSSSEIRVRGRISPRSQKALESMGVRVFENSW